MHRFMRALGVSVGLMALGLWVMSWFTPLHPAVVLGVVVLLGLMFMSWYVSGVWTENFVHHLVAGVVCGGLYWLSMMMGFTLPMWLMVLLAVLIAVVVADIVGRYLPGHHDHPHPAHAH